jgi:hypothetical protein
VRAAAIVLGLVLGLIALDACRAPRKQVRRARETHRLVADRPRR